MNEVLVGGIVRALLVVAAAVVFIGMPKTAKCTGGLCKIDVTVADCDGVGGVANPDPLPVNGPNNIQWEVVTTGYRFTVVGIRFVDPTQFPGPGSTAGGRKWMVHDDYSSTGDFKYSIRVFRESDNHECKLNDPLISNQ